MAQEERFFLTVALVLTFIILVSSAGDGILGSLKSAFQDTEAVTSAAVQEPVQPEGRRGVPYMIGIGIALVIILGLLGSGLVFRRKAEQEPAMEEEQPSSVRLPEWGKKAKLSLEEEFELVSQELSRVRKAEPPAPFVSSPRRSIPASAPGREAERLERDLRRINASLAGFPAPERVKEAVHTPRDRKLSLVEQKLSRLEQQQVKPVKIVQQVPSTAGHEREEPWLSRRLRALNEAIRAPLTLPTRIIKQESRLQRVERELAKVQAAEPASLRTPSPRRSIPVATPDVESRQLERDLRRINASLAGFPAPRVKEAAHTPLDRKLSLVEQKLSRLEQQQVKPVKMVQEIPLTAGHETEEPWLSRRLREINDALKAPFAALLTAAPVKDSRLQRTERELAQLRKDLSAEAAELTDAEKRKVSELYARLERQAALVQEELERF